MKRLLVILAAVAATTGCASLAQQGRVSADDDVDVAYVAAVERAARQFGTQVVWINYPRKRTTSQ